MNDEQFNIDLRRFLKQFGVAAQREIEESVRAAVARQPAGVDHIPVRATLDIGDQAGKLVIEATLHLT
ncbi:MAG: hypothetical protein NVS4B8_21890 [Herpetosiphon sp.]